MTGETPAHLGQCVLLGAGGGDPWLLTRAGAAWLGRADVVVYDRLVSPALLDLAPPEAERVYVGKRADTHALSQQQINQLLVERVRRGWCFASCRA
jgi:uroporphyrin-III C-methyltransferase